MRKVPEKLHMYRVMRKVSGKFYSGNTDGCWHLLDKNLYILKYFTAAAAKSLQSCPTLCNPIDGSPPGSPIPGILQARILEWVAVSFSYAWKWKVKVKSCPTPSDPVDCSLLQAPPSMGPSWQEYWSVLPLPSPNSIGRGKGNSPCWRNLQIAPGPSNWG